TPAEKAGMPLVNLAEFPPFLAPVFPPTIHHTTKQPKYGPRASCGHFFGIDYTNRGNDAIKIWYNKNGNVNSSTSVNYDPGKTDKHFTSTIKNTKLREAVACVNIESKDDLKLAIAGYTYDSQDERECNMYAADTAVQLYEDEENEKIAALKCQYRIETKSDQDTLPPMLAVLAKGRAETAA
ncbi:hypothetical protein ScalyP_jg6, partial [Parmales sp. scaly parma]